MSSFFSSFTDTFSPGTQPNVMVWASSHWPGYEPQNVLDNDPETSFTNRFRHVENWLLVISFIRLSVSTVYVDPRASARPSKLLAKVFSPISIVSYILPPWDNITVILNALFRPQDLVLATDLVSK